MYVIIDDVDPNLSSSYHQIADLNKMREKQVWAGEREPQQRFEPVAPEKPLNMKAPTKSEFFARFSFAFRHCF